MPVWALEGLRQGAQIAAWRAVSAVPIFVDKKPFLYSSAKLKEAVKWLVDKRNESAASSRSFPLTGA